MSLFVIADTSTGNVLHKITADHLKVKEHIVKFFKNSYDRNPNGVVVLTPNLAVLEQSETNE